MPPRVIYWCGWLDPQMVAVSKEMFQLMRAFPGSAAFGISPHYGLTFQPSARKLGMHPRFYPVARVVLPFIERSFDISHVYTSLGDWHFLNALKGSRPIVLTLTQRSTPASPELLGKVTHVVAESEALAEDARRAGIPAERISVIYPGVDLSVFRATPPPPQGSWRGVFASSPENASEITTKGLDLLLELAAREPSFDLTVLWRPFGPGSERALHEVRQRATPNVHIEVGRVDNIQERYAQAHFLLAPFRNVGKPSPNSVLEGLAVGRPALVSDRVDVGGFLERQRVAVQFPVTADGIQQAFHTLCRDYETLQSNSRRCAEAHFELNGVIERYRALYDRVRERA